MNKLLQRVFIVLLLVAVAVVFFAPSVDLEPTALRASQAAQALQVALISAALVLCGLLGFVGFLSLCSLHFCLGADCDLVALNCARLC